jgi:hypothetical protein
MDVNLRVLPFLIYPWNGKLRVGEGGTRKG